ncbi:MAG: protein-L-isoaspartate(D-aspartate) O-methyltransferase [Candidatus Lokiarchaeota archaeon]|nr:protein-L-isoaspartate(D-aspartate) O-methyltransferase [Candidatus Lokiarchaeota archaeon]
MLNLVFKLSLEDKKKKLLAYYKRANYANSPQVIRAFLEVPREKFVPDHMKDKAYIDSPLPIGEGQTISAPHMAFMMCEALEPALKVNAKVLEIGGGSGYHAAICAEIVAPSNIPKEERKGHIYTIERIHRIAELCRTNLQKAGYDDRVTVIEADGTLGFEEYAPYDAINVTAAGPKIPEPLVEQLSKDNGRLIIPVGARFGFQKLMLVIKEGEEVKEKNLGGVSFVPLKGEHGW